MAHRVSDEPVTRKKPEESIILLAHSDSGRLWSMLRNEGYRVTIRPDSHFDAVLFSGEGPVSPLLYGEPSMIATNRPQPNYLRDRNEWRLLRRLPRDIPKIGVGRGAHLLNAFNGGYSLQDVTGHTGIKSGIHKIHLYNGDYFEVSSNHFQLMVAGDGAHELAWAQKSFFKASHQFRRIYTKDEREQKWDDLEMCYYQHNNSFCYEPIPYGYHEDTEALFLMMMDDFINGTFDY